MGCTINYIVSDELEKTVILNKIKNGEVKTLDGQSNKVEMKSNTDTHTQQDEKIIPKITYLNKCSNEMSQRMQECSTKHTQDQKTATSALTYLITCMDFRLLDDVVRAMDAMGYNNNYDQFIVAGASLGLVQDKFPHWGETAINHMEIGLGLHAFRKVIVIDHEDCGAYKKFMPFKDYEEEKHNHQICVQKTYNLMSKKFPDFEFQGFLMDLDGNMKEIKIDRDVVKYEERKAEDLN